MVQVLDRKHQPAPWPFDAQQVIPEWRHLWADVFFATVPGWQRSKPYELVTRQFANTDNVSAANHQTVGQAGRSISPAGGVGERVLFNNVTTLWPQTGTAEIGTWIVYFQTDGSWDTGGTDPDDRAVLLARADDGNSQNGIVVSMESSGEPRLVAKPNGGAVIALDGTSQLADNDPHLLAVEWNQANGSTQRLWADGVLDNSGAVTGAWSFSSQNLNAFLAPADGFYEEYKGHCFYILWVNKHLSAAEHRKLFIDPWGPFRKAV